MAPTVLDLSTEALKGYRPMDAMRRRRREAGMEVARRRRKARLVARKAAKLLKEEYGAKKVYIFGSLARYRGFSLWSDVDIAVSGIRPERFFDAVGAVTGLSSEFKIDLVDLASCPPAMRRSITATGREV